MAHSKFVWLNLETGEFSNSWSESCEEDLSELIGDSRNTVWKLIEYKCHSDKDFEFYNLMKLK